jgi:hypothetical protein
MFLSSLCFDVLTKVTIVTFSDSSEFVRRSQPLHDVFLLLPVAPYMLPLLTPGFTDHFQSAELM